MKKFQILRYLKKLRYLVLVITILGCLATYLYIDKSQKYTAQAVLEYTNPTASEGTTPNGKPINPKEIFSSSVIDDVIKELGLSTSIDSIRSSCSAEECISEDEQKRKNAILDDGEEYDVVCTTYRIKFNANSSKSEDYVSNVLDSIINNYYVFYSKKYIDSAVVPNNSLNISAEKYDYINCVEILESSTQDIIDYLYNKNSDYPTFCSAKTGYTFGNLMEQYKYIRDNTISKYYALVLGEKLTNDKVELINYYENRRANDIITIENLTDHIEKQRTLLDQFGDKVTHSNSTVAGAIGDNTDAIIEEVEEYWKERLDVDTTYDDLISDYVDLKSQKNAAEVDRDYCTHILGIFNDDSVKNSVNTVRTQKLVSDMNKTIEELNELYDIVCQTTDEQYKYSAASNIRMLTGVYADKSINTKLFMALAVVLFLVAGLISAVILGRGIDIWEYIVYVDKKTGLANRAKCDLVIDEYAKKLLPDKFSCIAFKLDNLSTMNIRSGHDAGDSLLKRFGEFINRNLQDYGFVGYNGGNTFIVLLENCSKEKAEKYIEKLNKKVSEEMEDGLFDVVYGISESTADNTYEIRLLLQKAIERLGE